MKNLTIFLFLVLSLAGTYGQAPESFSYQAILRDKKGFVIKDQRVSLQISLLQGSVNGQTVYTETFSATTNDLGLVTLQIGTGDTKDDLGAVDWQAGPYFLKIAVDTSGGQDYTEMGTVQLLSVPYALHARSATSLLSGPGSIRYEDSTFMISSTDSVATLLRLRNGADTCFTVTGTGTIRAHAFRDMDDSTFFMDPDGSSRFNKLYIKQINAEKINFHDIHGPYAYADRYYDLSSIGYYLDPNGTSNLEKVRARYFYGDWFMDYHNQDYYLRLSSISRMKQLYVEKLYDLNDKNYYLDPNSISKLNYLYAYKIFDINDNRYYLDPNSISKLNYLTVNGMLAASKLYDKDNTDFYLDPTGKSVITVMNIKGSLGIGGDPQSGYQLYVYGNAHATGSWTSSDRRFKKNITPLGKELPKVMKLQGVHYQWRKEEFPRMHFEEGTEIGLVAQQVEKIFPELVREDGNGYKSVSYEKLTVVLLKALQEQQQMIERQEKSITTLEQEISKLKKKRP